MRKKKTEVRWTGEEEQVLTYTLPQKKEGNMTRGSNRQREDREGEKREERERETHSCATSISRPIASKCFQNSSAVACSQQRRPRQHSASRLSDSETKE
eukprot:1596155-Rhodomonas_salina.2